MTTLQKILRWSRVNWKPLFWGFCGIVVAMLLIVTAYRKFFESPVPVIVPTVLEETHVVEQGIAEGRAQVYQENAREYAVEAAVAASVAKPRKIPTEELKGDAGEKARILSKRFSGI